MVLRNDNVMTLSDCDGESYTPEEDPITIKADHDAATIWVCLPSDVETAGLIVKVDDGTWPSEVSWEVRQSQRCRIFLRCQLMCLLLNLLLLSNSPTFWHAADCRAM